MPKLSDAELSLAGAASPAVGSPASLDPVAVLRASQDLYAERNTAKLKARIEALLGDVAGATHSTLAWWDEHARQWALPAEDGRLKPVTDEAAAQRVPLSALQQVQRTGETLVLADALAHPGFAADPYFAGLARCSLMVLPIRHEGAAGVLLVLENRAMAGAFSGERLEAVHALAGQLAASLHNARSYGRLERRVSVRTRQLRQAQARLRAEAQHAGMAQIATNVLHNVGNVLTSVNISAHVLSTKVRQSPGARLDDLARMLNDEAGDLQAFFAPGGKGRLLPGYLRELAAALGTEREQMLAELQRLSGSVDHIKNVIAMQQSYAGVGRLLESVLICDLVDDALRIHESSLARHGVRVARDYGPVGVATLDKTRVMQILVNLLENARQAMDEVVGDRRMDVTVRQEGGSIVVSVRDFGCGIPAENLHRIFMHGFTTKSGGHGFGLHSCAVAAQEMGGSLAAFSDGPGTGATFVLRLPADTS